MSQLVDLYNSSNKQRVRESRERIPRGGTDFFDQQHKFSDGFTTNLQKGSPTQYTEDGLDQYNEDKASLVPPESYNPELPLHRYTPETPFFEPGAPPGGTQ